MAISTNYSTPVTVNGFTCRNCSEVDQAKKFIDPAHPAAGPFGVNDPRKAEKDFFSPEARDLDRLKELHEERIKPPSAAAAAYGTPAGAARAA
ncbi:MAG: hypothetical protein P8Y58_00445, partial [Novosphingobium sp.]